MIVRTKGQKTITTAHMRSPTQKLQIMRLSPDRDYDFRVKALTLSGKTIVMHAEVKSGATGRSDFDAGPLAVITGTPTWEMLVTDWYFGGPLGTLGLVAVDNTGWVVWYSVAASPVWDQVPETHAIVSINCTKNSSTRFPLLPGLLGGLTESSPFGDSVRSLDPPCNIWSGGEVGQMGGRSGVERVVWNWRWWISC